MSDRRWAWTVRALALLAFVLAVVAGLEARAIREARQELQALRAERAGGVAAMNAAWARVSIDDSVAALQALNTMFEDPAEGLGRPGGLCTESRLDGRAIADFLRVFLGARGAGLSRAGAIDTMQNAVRSTSEFRSQHPDLAPAR